jgi:ankyrin repeat protein
MTAAMKGHVDTVRSLLDKPDVDIDAKTANGLTALSFASLSGHLEVVKLLVAAGGRVNPQGSNEWGPLMAAASGGSLQVVKYLVEEAGADVQCTDPNGMTLFMCAAGGGDIDVVEYLRGRQDIDIDAKTATGHTALDLACGKGHLKVVKLLVAAGARVNPQARNELGALESAVLGGRCMSSSIWWKRQGLMCGVQALMELRPSCALPLRATSTLWSICDAGRISTSTPRMLKGRRHSTWLAATVT